MVKNLFFIILVLTSISTYSQIAPIDTLKFSGNLNIAGSLTSGKEFQRSLQIELNPTIKKRSWSLENQFRFLYSDTDGEVLNRNWDALSKYKIYFKNKSKWYPFFVADLQTNLGYELEFRMGYGAGLTFKPTLKKNSSQLLFSMASAYYRNRYSESIFTNSNRIGNQRNMVRLILHYTQSTQLIENKLVLKTNGWFLQSTRESADYILKLSISLEFSFARNMSLITNYRFIYENVTLESLDNRQQFTSIGVKADFN